MKKILSICVILLCAARSGAATEFDVKKTPPSVGPGGEAAPNRCTYTWYNTIKDREGVDRDIPTHQKNCTLEQLQTEQAKARALSDEIDAMIAEFNKLYP